MSDEEEITKPELAQRVRVAGGFLRLMWPKHEIKDTLQRLFGINRVRAAEDIDVARALLAEEGNESRVSRRYRVGGFLEGFMRSYALEPQERLKAAKQYSELYGLNDRSDQEAKPQDINIVIPDWRAVYKQRLARGQAASAKALNGGNGCQSTDTGENGTKAAEKNGSPRNGTNGTNGTNGNGKSS